MTKRRRRRVSPEITRGRNNTRTRCISLHDVHRPRLNFTTGKNLRETIFFVADHPLVDILEYSHVESVCASVCDFPSYSVVFYLVLECIPWEGEDRRENGLRTTIAITVHFRSETICPPRLLSQGSCLDSTLDYPNNCACGMDW